MYPSGDWVLLLEVAMFVVDEDHNVLCAAFGCTKFFFVLPYN